MTKVKKELQEKEGFGNVELQHKLGMAIGRV